MTLWESWVLEEFIFAFYMGGRGVGREIKVLPTNFKSNAHIDRRCKKQK